MCVTQCAGSQRPADAGVRRDAGTRSFRQAGDRVWHLAIVRICRPRKKTGCQAVDSNNTSRARLLQPCLAARYGRQLEEGGCGRPKPGRTAHPPSPPGRLPRDRPGEGPPACQAKFPNPLPGQVQLGAQPPVRPWGCPVGGGIAAGPVDRHGARGFPGGDARKPCTLDPEALRPRGNDPPVPLPRLIAWSIAPEMAARSCNARKHRATASWTGAAA